ncbi:hypothetical protein SLS60_011321 [Paraconiothyrium brasiliense]|uniref:Uncharacterized protein n=1 Tax=Paraconiothyrium brasiliense TaxID=300254 RepID=A0ABR3QK00_9PLEO
MLLGRSTFEYVLIKALVYFCSYLGLICLAYSYLALSIGGVRVITHPVSIAIEVLGAIEILFYLLWFLPYRSYLRKQKSLFPPSLDRENRQDLFDRSLAVTPDIELYVKKWMCGASLEDMRRENVKEWLLWALFDREGPPGDDEEELEGYVEAVEETLGRNIRPGWGPVSSIRLNFRKFSVSHRSLTYYMVIFLCQTTGQLLTSSQIIGTIDFFSSMILLASGFSFYRQPRVKFMKSFPLRPLTLFAPKQSASPNFSYFYRPHKSTTHRPIVFIHGLGIGLAIYIPFFLMLPKDIGILAIEVLPISSRITEAGVLPADQVREIGDIITQQNIDSFVFMGNSYGTFFTKLLLETPFLASRMARIVLMDPVAILLHIPDLAYNATSRVPVYPNEIEIAWAATTEPDIAFTLAKRFCWRSHILWQEDLLRVPTTIVIGSDDCVVNAEAIAAYITKGAPQPDPASVESKPDLQWSWADRKSWERNEWSGQGLELYWLEGYDHGQGLFSSRILRNIVKLVERYCARDTDEVEVPPEKELPHPPEDADVEGSELVPRLKGKDAEMITQKRDSVTSQ